MNGRRMEHSKKIEGLSSLEVARVTGATLRQLQWLDEHSFICPKRGRGKHSNWRQYSEQQVGTVRDLVRLPGHLLSRRLQLLKTLIRKDKTVAECLEWFEILKPFLAYERRKETGTV